jgi:phosphopantothenoylcysteine decarboxylase/phosphopantothenate--cysteine ligase
MSIRGKNVLVGVCGSIAAYKSAFIIRLLIKEGAQVRVIMTNGAQDFITPLTLATLSKNECNTTFTNATKTDWNNHVELGLWADVLLIAPLSAGTLAKLANGICDNLLVATYLSARCPIYFAPAMDEDMWKHGSTIGNIDKLISYGNKIISVNEGELASGLVGPGRMAEPEDIIAILKKELGEEGTLLKNKKVVITAGPTYEAIDPVRFVGNHSTGKMGICLAELAAKRGADVILILGPTLLKPKIETINVINVVSAQEMYKAFQQHVAQLDIAIFSAAVADYKPENPANQKIKKKTDDFQIQLVKTIDIAAEFGKIKKPNQLSVGFALETENETDNASKKVTNKNLEFVVLNSLNDKGAGFRHATNKITIVDKQNKITNFELKTKESVAEDILDYLESYIK